MRRIQRSPRKHDPLYYPITSPDARRRGRGDGRKKGEHLTNQKRFILNKIQRERIRK
jgi:hypothetical protein